MNHSQESMGKKKKKKKLSIQIKNMINNGNVLPSFLGLYQWNHSFRLGKNTLNLDTLTTLKYYPCTVAFISEGTIDIQWIMIQCAELFILPAVRHTTPASSPCPQLWTPHPPWRHSDIEVSSPTHLTSSSHIWPFPCPNSAPLDAAKAPSYPSWRQTTSASCKSHEWSQMVPHVPLNSTSTRPEDGQLAEPTKRTVVDMRIQLYVGQSTVFRLFF